jgi:hypothetical protein
LEVRGPEFNPPVLLKPQNKQTTPETNTKQNRNLRKQTKNLIVLNESWRSYISIF